MLSATFILRLLLALTCVVGLIWYIGRRLGNGGPQQRGRASREPGLKVVGRQSMGRHTGVAVVAVGQRRILIGYGEQQVSMLTELGPVFDELPTPRAEVSAPETAPAPTPWVSVARATRAAAAGMIPTPRGRRSATPRAITPENLAAAGVPAAPAPLPTPRALDASPIDRLDQDAWPTLADVAPTAPAALAPVEPAPGADAVVGTPANTVVATPAADPKASALTGSILAPDTWRQAVRSLQDRTVRR